MPVICRGSVVKREAMSEGLSVVYFIKLLVFFREGRI